MYILTKINKYLLLFSLVFLSAIGLATILEDYIIFIIVSYLGVIFSLTIIIKQDFIKLSQEKKYVAEKLHKQSIELEDIIVQLAQTKQKLIQAEKMAILGKETAGIIHEINTPLSVISSSISTTKMFLEQILEQLPILINLSTKPEFLELLKKSSQSLLSSKKERELKNDMAKQLSKYSINNNAVIANYLISMGIYSEVKTFLPLLKLSNNVAIFKTAYKISALQTIFLSSSTAIDKIIKIITAVNSYGNDYNQKVTTNIIDNIEIILTLYHNKIKRGVEVIRNYSELPLIMCYPNELGQVWTNLIYNALHAMDYHGILQIEVKLQNTNILVNIIDNGVGIPTNIQEKIFEPFFTTKTNGNGLGLDIVKKIIDKHDGQITVDSKPNQTVFSIFIPIT